MTVAWVDTTRTGADLGRGLLMAGRWATRSEAKPGVPRHPRAPAFPVRLPITPVNRWTLRMLNELWWLKHGSRPRQHIVDPYAFFHPLDLLREWNRGYGRKGFTQYQCVMPSSPALWREFLEHFQRLGGASFVTVLKDCGPQGTGTLSFPMKGTSMALDIPVTRDTPRLVRELNAIVIANGGRVYLAKDAFTASDEFRAMYPRFDEWNAIRHQWDPQRTLRSALSVRLMGDDGD
jgi:FAD/FMN-containing dehydrogenase